MTSYLIPVYATYLVVTVVLCTFLARSLYRNGTVFLADVFEDRPEMADSVNRLLVTGFAMLNVGYGFLIMRADWADDATSALEVLAGKLGVLLVSLAVVHFVNLGVLHHLGQRRRQREMVPPIAPQRWVTEPAEPVAF
ncbi:MAG: hypothetical protein U0P45_00635 [Acidimicrobiales bacterium]